MCGRFTLKTDANALAQHFEIEDAHFPPPRYNVAPTQAIPVIRFNPATGRRELTLQRWGLVPHWAKDRPADPGAKPLPNLINARAETLASKPAFRDAFRQRRCLIPADGFYEWKALPGGRKQPYYVRRPGGGPFGFAGLWEGETCTIITTTPTPLLRPLHDRMPAIPPRENYAAWLDPSPRPPEDLLALLRPGVELELYPVSPLVNRATHDAPDCIAPAPA